MTCGRPLTHARRGAADDGFTLIELLIVIVILGVLAGITVFAVSAFNNNGIAAACKADVKNVEVASEAFFANKQSYAASIGSVGSTDTNSLVGAGYLKEPPPSAKYTVTYSLPSTSAGAAPAAPAIAGTWNGSPC